MKYSENCSKRPHLVQEKMVFEWRWSLNMGVEKPGVLGSPNFRYMLEKINCISVVYLGCRKFRVGCRKFRVGCRKFRVGCRKFSVGYVLSVLLDG
jgi:hypothetical protein